MFPPKCIQDTTPTQCNACCMLATLCILFAERRCAQSGYAGTPEVQRTTTGTAGTRETLTLTRAGGARSGGCVAVVRLDRCTVRLKDRRATVAYPGAGQHEQRTRTYSRQPTRLAVVVSNVCHSLVALTLLPPRSQETSTRIEWRFHRPARPGRTGVAFLLSLSLFTLSPI